MGQFFIVTVIALQIFATPNLYNVQMGRLKVKITNFKNREGKAVINLFRKEDDFLKNAFQEKSSEIESDKDTVTIIFYDLPFADYSIRAFHDKNDNKKLDHSLIGPLEPYGWSNNWKFSFFNGMPTFEKTKFKFSQANQVVLIPIN